MPYQSLPIDGGFDNPTSYSARIISQRFHPGQVEVRGYDGANSVLHTKQINQYIVGLPKKQELENFLSSRRGITPFYFSGQADATTNNCLYVCQKYSFRRVNDNSTLYGDVYQFSAELRQVFRPGY